MNAFNEWLLHAPVSEVAQWGVLALFVAVVIVALTTPEE